MATLSLLSLILCLTAAHRLNKYLIGEATTNVVAKKKRIEETIQEAYQRADYMNVSSLIETSSTSSSSGIGGQTFALDFELHKMKLGGKGNPSELPQVYSRKVAVSATSALRTTETLTFGKTATIVVTLERVAAEVGDTLTASQPLTPAQPPVFRVKEARALAEVAAALSSKASTALEGRISHKFLSQCGERPCRGWSKFSSFDIMFTLW